MEARMAVGIGQAIDDAAKAREERERQEWEAIGLISKHIADYLEGGPDLEAEDVELGRRAGATDLEVIGLRWKVVRGKRAAKLKGSSFLPEAQPISAEPKV